MALNKWRGDGILVYCRVKRMNCLLLNVYTTELYLWLVFLWEVERWRLWIIKRLIEHMRVEDSAGMLLKLDGLHLKSIISIHVYLFIECNGPLWMDGIKTCNTCINKPSRRAFRTIVDEVLMVKKKITRRCCSNQPGICDLPTSAGLVVW